MVLGNYVIEDMGGSIQDAFGGIGPILLPIAIAGAGIIISAIGTMLVKIKDNDAKEAQVMGALNVGNWVSIGLVAVSCYALVKYMLPETMQMEFFGEGTKDITAMRVFYATLIGLFVGGVISSVTEYYTGLGKKPILKIVQQSSTGAGTNIIAGLATGMISTFPTILLFAGAIWAVLLRKCIRVDLKNVLRVILIQTIQLILVPTLERDGYLFRCFVGHFETQRLIL